MCKETVDHEALFQAFLQNLQSLEGGQQLATRIRQQLSKAQQSGHGAQIWLIMFTQLRNFDYFCKLSKIYQNAIENLRSALFKMKTAIYVNICVFFTVGVAVGLAMVKYIR